MESSLVTKVPVSCRCSYPRLKCYPWLRECAFIPCVFHQSLILDAILNDLNQSLLSNPTLLRKHLCVPGSLHLPPSLSPSASRSQERPFDPVYMFPSSPDQPELFSHHVPPPPTNRTPLTLRSDWTFSERSVARGSELE